jgi:hypothetical protein
MTTERGERRMQTVKLKKLVKVLENTCWEFRGAKDSKGRGMMRWDGELRLAHQVFFEVLFSPVSEGSKLIHYLPKDRCIGAACCNPAHMRVWKEGMPKPLAGLKMCKKGHVIDETNMITENRKGHPIARCRICRQEAWRVDKRRARSR